MAAETKRDTEPAQSDLRRTGARIVLAAIMVVIGVVAYNRFTGGDDNDDSSGGGGGSVNDDIGVGAPDAAEVTTTFADPSAPAAPACPAFDGSSPRQVQFSGPPPMCIDPALDWRARVVTTRGHFDIELDSETAPVAVNNFVFLALWHYYEGVGFHRVVPDTFIHAGDATGSGPDCSGAGCGGPGYRFAGEPPTGQSPFYPLGSVAMANTGAGTDGSQFFVVVGPGGEVLPPDFSRLGRVFAGDLVVEEIAATGENADARGVPDELTVIETVSVWVVENPLTQGDGDIGLAPDS